MQESIISIMICHFWKRSACPWRDVCLRLSLACVHFPIPVTRNSSHPSIHPSSIHVRHFLICWGVTEQCCPKGLGPHNLSSMEWSQRVTQRMLAREPQPMGDWAEPKVDPYRTLASCVGKTSGGNRGVSIPASAYMRMMDDLWEWRLGNMKKPLNMEHPAFPPSKLNWMGIYCWQHCPNLTFIPIATELVLFLNVSIPTKESSIRFIIIIIEWFQTYLVAGW